ncbi:ABC transporter permease [Halorarius litoreus]|jgi:ABC-2 type transport system permease protein|uniref:ABC transporter permease n=1 Tax=Halorarius litoreus TaxID=2962676 RepID=UPI0020CDEBD6|nr:ABC transporter permease [Halorarius litoreus]
MTGRAERFTTIFERELRTLARSRSVWLLAIGFFGLTVTAALLSGTSGYVPLALTLLTPLELVLPVFAAALGYRAILADRQRGELSMLRTYPLDGYAYTVGVYCGRLTALLGIIVVTLLLAVILVPVLNPDPAALARTAGLDSPLYYLRFVVLTAAFAAVILAFFIFLSAVVGTARRGLVGAIVGVLVVSIGLDLAIVLGLASGVVNSGALPWYLAVSPASAYRGLVMTYVVAPVTTTPVRPAIPAANAVGLAMWGLLLLLGAGSFVWGPVTYVQE